jgi:hypothetical protein
MTTTTERLSSREKGSAYIIALLVLVVVSILALSLALVTQTERQVGANEKTLHRVLYAADAGIGTSIARVLVTNSSVNNTTVTAVTPMTYTMPEPAPMPGFQMANQVEITPYVPILSTSCNWCPTNVGDQNFFKVNHAVAASAQRLGWRGADPTTPAADAVPTGQKRLFLMVELQPWWQPDWRSISDPSQVATIVQE